MIDFLALLASGIAGGAAGGWVVGLLYTPRRPSRVKAICDSCDHGIGCHTDKVGQCQVEYDDDTICACAHYDGPTPFHGYYAEDITP